MDKQLPKKIVFIVSPLLSVPTSADLNLEILHFVLIVGGNGNLNFGPG